MAVTAAVTNGTAELARGLEQGLPQRRVKRPVEDPMAAAGCPGLGVQRAQGPVRQAVGQEEQVVEDDQRAELQPRVERPTDGDGEDRPRAALAECVT